MSLCRAVIDALLPPGSIWVPEDGQDLDLLFDGMADNCEELRQFLYQLSRIRSPLDTPMLDDLELDYGIIPNDMLSEVVRRQRLLVTKTDRNINGSAERMEEILQRAGFNVYVHVNSPAVDPDGLISFGNSAVMGNEDAIFGRSDAQFGSGDSDIVVNGLIYENQIVKTYGSPPAEYWPLVFFIGGQATRNINGELTSIGSANVDGHRRKEFISTILKLKPMSSWCGLVVSYV